MSIDSPGHEKSGSSDVEDQLLVSADMDDKLLRKTLSFKSSNISDVDLNNELITPNMIWNYVKRERYCMLDTYERREAIVYESMMQKMDAIIIIGSVSLIIMFFPDIIKEFVNDANATSTDAKMLDTIFVIFTSACLVQTLNYMICMYSRWHSVTKDFMLVTMLLFVYLTMYTVLGCYALNEKFEFQSGTTWAILSMLDFICFVTFIYRALDPHSKKKHGLFVLCIMICLALQTISITIRLIQDAKQPLPAWLKAFEAEGNHAYHGLVNGKFLMWCFVLLSLIWHKLNCCLPVIPTTKNVSLFDFVITYRCFLLLPLSMYNLLNKNANNTTRYIWVTMPGFYVMMCSAFLLSPLSNSECQTIHERNYKAAREFSVALCLKCFDLALNIYHAVEDGLIQRGSVLDGETWFHVIHLEDTVFIVFRGTAFDKRDNVRTDLDMWRITLDEEIFEPGLFHDMEYKGIKVHRGFHNAYLQANEDLKSRLEEINLQNGSVQQVVICGHSLGSALAQLCALDLRLHLPELNIKMYLFASPKVGNSRFAMIMNKRFPKQYYRIIMEGDPADDFPLIGGYVQAGTKVWMNSKGEINFNMGHMRKWVMPYQFTLSHHRMNSYGDALMALCRELLRKGEVTSGEISGENVWEKEESLAPYMSRWPVEMNGWVHNLRGLLTTD